MAMKIITGYTGTKHITAADDAGLMKGILGADDYVLNAGNTFEATMTSSTEIQIASGELVMQGRHARIDSGYETLTIDNGTQGTLRNDLVVARYSIDATTGIESIGLAVIKGTEIANSKTAVAVDPVYNTGNIDSGETRDFPLYRIKLNEITVESVDKLFSPVVAYAGHEHSMEDITETPAKVRAFFNTNPVLLWENDNPTHDFGDETVQLFTAEEISGGSFQIYGLYLVVFRILTTNTRKICAFATIDERGEVQWIENIYSSSSELKFNGRQFKVISGYEVEFGNCFSVESFGSISATTEGSDRLIPVAIYGIHTI